MLLWFFFIVVCLLSQVQEIEGMLRSLMVAGPLGNQLRMVKIELKANSFHNKRDYGIEEVQNWLNFVILNILTQPWAKCGLFAAAALRPIFCGLIAAFCLKIFISYGLQYPSHLLKSPSCRHVRFSPGKYLVNCLQKARF